MSLPLTQRQKVNGSIIARPSTCVTHLTSSPHVGISLSYAVTKSVSEDGVPDWLIRGNHGTLYLRVSFVS